MTSYLRAVTPEFVLFCSIKSALDVVVILESSKIRY